MLSLFPVHRPSFGVGICATSISLVALRRLPFCRPAVARAAERPLQAGWLVPSNSTPNIANMEALQQELSALTKPLRHGAAAVSLPDDTATIGLFSLTKLPEKPQDREAVIRWRFQQEMDVKIGTERLVYRSYAGGGTVSLLAAAVDASILAQYHALFEAASLLPVSLGFHTFHLFDALRGSMTERSESFFVHRTAESLTFLALSHGRPMFFRQRRLKSPGAAIRDELFSTLQYFDDRFPPCEKGSDIPTPLYFVDTRVAASSREDCFGAPLTMTVPALHRSKPVEVIPLGWNAFPLATNEQYVSGSLLPAAAGVGIA